MTQISGPMIHPGARPKGSEETALYRLYDESGQLLYVGIGRNPMARWAVHAEQDWWSQVSRFAVVWYPTRKAALEAELHAIHQEAPTCNMQGTPRGSLATGAGVRAALERARQRERATSQ